MAIGVSTASPRGLMAEAAGKELEVMRSEGEVGNSSCSCQGGTSLRITAQRQKGGVRPHWRTWTFFVFPESATCGPTGAVPVGRTPTHPRFCCRSAFPNYFSGKTVLGAIPVYDWGHAQEERAIVGLGPPHGLAGGARGTNPARSLSVVFGAA